MQKEKAADKEKTLSPPPQEIGQEERQDKTNTDPLKDLYEIALERARKLREKYSGAPLDEK